MPQQVRAWKVSTEGTLREISTGRLDVEQRLEDWITRDISIVDSDLLLVGRQVRTDYGGFIDLLAIDAEGDLVILELKRDRSPREVVAQALDYASWVAELSHERITEIADGFFDAPGGLEKAFRDKFGDDLPESLNASHRIVIVTGEVDAGSERIIQYLSRNYGVNINAVTFQYFRDTSGEELFTRVFLLEPADVEQQARGKGPSRRKPNLTLGELQQIAEDNNAGELFSDAVATFKKIFEITRTTLSSVGFYAQHDRGSSVMLNVVPGGSCPRGLKFQIYATRISRRFAVSESELMAVLPHGAHPWKYYANAPDDWAGFEGCFSNVAEIARLASLLEHREAV